MRYCKVTLAISLLNETTPTYLISALISTFVSSAWISRQQTTASHCRFTLFTQIRLWCWMWRMWRWIKSKSMTSKLCPLKNNSSFVPASLFQVFFLGTGLNAVYWLHLRGFQGNYVKDLTSCWRLYSPTESSCAPSSAAWHDSRPVEGRSRKQSF